MPVERGAADAEDLGDLELAHAAVTHLPGLADLIGGVIFGGRPPVRPRARAAASPTWVRSLGPSCWPSDRRYIVSDAPQVEQ